jgi:acetoacetyl-CoA synthetase
MMWNWLVSGLASEATIMLYDGSPSYPGNSVLFDYIDEEDIAIFGTSAKFIDALAKSGTTPRITHDLSSLKSILSTGSPLAPEGFDYVYEYVKSDVCLSSIAGGTDIISCFVLGNPTLPVWSGEVQCLALGMDVRVLDDEGNALDPGQKGELACANSFPSMPVGFWNDPDGSKYSSAYFEKVPNVWCHGDYVELTEHGGMIIHGRSDAVLNPGGVRIGTAEIYRQAEQVDEVVESMVIGQRWDNDVRVVLFVRLRENVELEEELVARIKKRIRENASIRHVPAKVIQVADIPRTKSGKIVELAVRSIVHGEAVKNREALANPEALELYKDIEELRS